jgi:hypothetical protein
MTCKDPSLIYLKNFGYNVVRLPRTDIAPLQLFSKKKNSLEPLGDLLSLLNAGASVNLPQIKKDEKMSEISGHRTGKLGLDIGLSILGNILGAMAEDKVGIDAAYKNASELTFEFKDVLGDSVEIVKLDQFLNDAGANPFSKHVLKMLNDDEVYLITSVIKSKAILVDAFKSNNGDLNLDASLISKILSPKINATIESSNKAQVTYNGENNLVFGFKAIRLIYENGKYVAFENLKSVVPLNAKKPKADHQEYKLLLNNTMIDYSPLEVVQ